MAKCGTEKRAKRNVILSFQERDQRGQINVGEKAHIRERKKWGVQKENGKEQDDRGTKHSEICNRSKER